MVVSPIMSKIKKKTRGKAKSNGKGPDPLGKTVVLTFQGFRIQVKAVESRYHYGRWDVRYELSKFLKEPAKSDWAQFPVS